MKITIDISETLKKELKKTVVNKKKSMSSVVREAIDYYIRERTKKKLAQKALALVGKTRISPDILTDLEEGRKNGDRI